MSPLCCATTAKLMSAMATEGSCTCHARAGALAHVSCVFVQLYLIACIALICFAFTKHAIKSADASCYRTSSRGPRVQVAVDLPSPAGERCRCHAAVSVILHDRLMADRTNSRGLFADESWITVSVKSQGAVAGRPLSTTPVPGCQPSLSVVNTQVLQPVQWAAKV